MQSELTIDALAQEIRRVDGNHSLGAGALAEALMPFLAALPTEQTQPVATLQRYLYGQHEQMNVIGRSAAMKLPHGNYLLYTSPPLSREGVGTAEVIEKEIASVVQSVNEWDDRTSPDDYPEHLLITSEELADILRNFSSALAATRSGSATTSKDADHG